MYDIVQWHALQGKLMFFLHANKSEKDISEFTTSVGHLVKPYSVLLKGLLEAYQATICLFWGFDEWSLHTCSLLFTVATRVPLTLTHCLELMTHANPVLWCCVVSATYFDGWFLDLSSTLFSMSPWLLLSHKNANSGLSISHSQYIMLPHFITIKGLTCPGCVKWSVGRADNMWMNCPSPLA